MTKAKATVADQTLERVRAVCMAFAGVEEKLSHGAPAFHVRGKLLATFVDNHHDDGRLALWIKSTHKDQHRIVAEDPDQFFVPPYYGVQGWVGMRLDRPSTDWVGLPILIEEAWLAVAPPRVREGKAPPRPKSPPPERKKTDEKIARTAVDRVTKICLALADATIEREGQHATFRAKNKVFAYFLDNHHGDGIVAVCVKLDKAKAAALVKQEPARFTMPAYIGPRGWVGVRLDGAKIDWEDVAARIAASHAAAGAKPARAARAKAK